MARIYCRKGANDRFAASRFVARRQVHRLWRFSLLLTIAAFTGGCAAINQFAVTPRAACRGSTVKATWSARGSVRLTSQPTLKGTGVQPSAGEKTFVVDQPTHFVLHAGGLLGSHTAEADVDVAPAQRGYGANARCNGNTRLITAQVVLSHQLSERFRVDTVGNPLSRGLQVSKGGRSASIAAGGQSKAFEGETARGTWQLASPLKGGETCMDAMHALRRLLELELKLQCGG